MLRKELLLGFVIAGFASIAVPTAFWRALFVTGHGLASTLENVVVGPFLAFISFVCSIGNVPLGAALWKGGISFGGVIAFIFADLLALPLVLIYRRFYGTRLALRLSLVFWAVMSAAGLLTELSFSALRLVPGSRPVRIVPEHIGLNATTVLNVLALLAFGYLYWLYRNTARLGGGHGYAKDVVCGMQVRTADAPARARHAGHMYYFCSDRCLHRFQADPDRYARGDAVEGMPEAAPVTPEVGGESEAVIDPVCGMTVDPATDLRADYAGREYLFCSPGCRDTFTADPVAHLQHARDPVCGMDVDIVHPAARATADGIDYVFCSPGCRDAFISDPSAHLPGALR